MSLVIWLIVAIVVIVVGLQMAGGLLSLVWSLLIGAVAGWLAGTFMRGRGFGVLKNVIVGIVGAVVGRILFSLAGFHGAGIVASIVTATVGAIVVLYCVQWIQSS
jgi:uncharacterized membrane protein YeaQ/YmgE (transglycosylase-associated protein family)